MARIGWFLFQFCLDGLSFFRGVLLVVLHSHLVLGWLVCVLLCFCFRFGLVAHSYWLGVLLLCFTALGLCFCLIACLRVFVALFGFSFCLFLRRIIIKLVFW